MKKRVLRGKGLLSKRVYVYKKIVYVYTNYYNIYFIIIIFIILLLFHVLLSSTLIRHKKKIRGVETTI